MKKVMHILMLSCLKATELIEKKMGGHLSMVQKMQLGMHKSMCKACSTYEKQSIFLNEVLKHPYHANDVDLQNLKKSIISKIDKY